MSISTVALAGSIAPTAIPLQIDTTIGIGAAIVLALTVFVVAMVYLAFGPHNTVLQDDETGIGRGRSAAGDGEPSAEPDSDAEAVQGQPDEPNANASAGTGTGDGSEGDGASST